MLVVLVGLGVWQVRRLAWKTALLHRIDLAEAAPPVPLSPDATSFEKVDLSGRLLPGSARFGVQVQPTKAGDRLGSDLIVPLQPASGLPVLVDLGWLQDDARPVLPAGTLHVVGYVRRPEAHSWLSASDDTAGRRFYTLDPQAIGDALRLQVAPFVVVALLPVEAGGPVPTGALPRPVNNHLAYAGTWFGLAVTLAVVYGIWLAKGRRRQVR